MDDAKDKAKGILKKLNPFSSSSRRFKGEGHRLGSSSPDPPSSNTPRPGNQQQQQQDWRRAQQDRWEASNQTKRPSKSSSAPAPALRNPTPVPTSISSPAPALRNPTPVPTSISSPAPALRNPTPVPASNSSPAAAVENPSPVAGSTHEDDASEPVTEIVVAKFLSSEPPDSTVQVLLRLLSNISKDPTASKFRRIRLANPKILESIGSSPEALELLHSLGFTTISEENEEVCIMEEPSVHQLRSVDHVVSYLEKHLSPVKEAPEKTSGKTSEKALDSSEVRVFYATSETSQVLPELPDSFYQLSLSEVRSITAAKRKALEDSQLLIPKSYREKQAAAARQKYKFSVIRVQFPDNVLLQRVFLPSQTTASVYTFVRDALKNEVSFELIDPAARRVVADSEDSTIDQANLLPSALLKFQTSSPDFSGLRADYLSRIEPLTSSPF